MLAKSFGDDSKMHQVHCWISSRGMDAQVYQCRFHVGIFKLHLSHDRHISSSLNDLQNASQHISAYTPLVA